MEAAASPSAPASIERAPGSAVIAELLRVQELAAPRTGLGRILGVSPLNDESRPWYLGALGEREVARRLEELGPEWLVLHAVPVGERGSDIDHLVVSAAGVFTINSKFHEDARVWVGSRRLLVNGQKQDHLRNSRFEARRVARILADLGSVPVSSVLAIVGAREITIREQPADVAVIKATRLTKWLRRRPPVLDALTLESVRAAVTDPARWGTPPPFDPTASERFAALQREVKGAKLVRMAWGTALLVGLVGFGVAQGIPLFASYFG
ncbi:nuclease-related domain-containing protein [Microbacterium sp. JZ31]|uniref:nuclease-related domain-containing protein n=1 Tax=Microbacterium sp. JZ31 TaxID=1906274 RepID=UPI001933FD5A|nr:nuclease-related domain-containing protein [Microbacterium sp. JZ31]